MVSLCIANNKGGVGKTTTALNLAAELSKMGRSVLLVDFDPQASLTIYLRFDPTQFEKNAYHIITRHASPEDVIVRTSIPGVDLIPSSIDLSAAEIEVIMQMNREYILKEQLTKVADHYDYMIVDNMPSLGILTVNSLMASDYVIVPVEPTFLSYKGLELISSLVDDISVYNKGLHIMGTVITMFDGRSNHSKIIADKIRETFPTFNVCIRRSVRFQNAAVAGLPIADFAEKKFSGAIEYRKLAREVDTIVTQES